MYFEFRNFLMLGNTVMGMLEDVKGPLGTLFASYASVENFKVVGWVQEVKRERQKPLGRED